MMIVSNIKNTIKNQCSLFAFLCVIQVLAIVIIMFSYGIFINSQLGMRDLEYEGQLYMPDFTRDKIVKLTQENKEKLINVLNKYGDSVERLLIVTKTTNTGEECEDNLYSSDGYFFRSDIKVINGKIVNVAKLKHENITGRLITNDDENNGNSVCVITKSYGLKEGDKLSLGTNNYEVIGVDNYEGSYDDISGYLYLGDNFGVYEYTAYVPFNSLPDNGAISEFVIRFNRVIISDEIIDLNNSFRDIFGNDIIQYPEGARISYDKVKTYKSLMTIVCILAILAAHCIISIYVFMLQKRERETGILLLCGAKKRSIMTSYNLEMLIQFIVSSAVGYVLFQKVLRRWLDLRYKWFFYIFSEQMGDCIKLLVTFGVIVIVITSICIVLEIKKTPINIIKQN